MGFIGAALTPVVGPPLMPGAAKMASPEKTFSFAPSLSFAEARDRLRVLHDPAHKDLVAKLFWLEGSSAGNSLTYLWDPMAERFGHTIDKEPIDHAVVENLINGLAVEVRLVEGKKGKK